MNNHDPLCLCADDSERCGNCYIEDCSCDCWTIRRVRRLILRDVIEAVWNVPAKEQYDDEGWLSLLYDKGEIVAAIEALHVYEEGSNLTAGSTVGSFLNNSDATPDIEGLSLKPVLEQNQPKNGDD